jgi:hypothetical protein
LTNVGKHPYNFEFSENNFRSHDGRGKILKVMKAQANGIICSGMTEVVKDPTLGTEVISMQT